MAETQRGLFGEDFAPKREAEVKAKSEAASRDVQLKLFATDGKPGQLDFLGEMPGSEAAPTIEKR